MAEPVETFKLLKDVLTADDVAFLKTACQRHFRREDCVPSYVLLDAVTSPTCEKIKKSLEEDTGQKLYYLNDFYLYSDDTFQANWHMDTELFTFRSCVNAWILLSPDEVENPLAFIDGVNNSETIEYHSAKIDGDECVFTNFRDRSQHVRRLSDIEQEKVATPKVCIGDILAINPKKFHKTNTIKPKHAIAIKYLGKGEHGFFSDAQVPALFWAETKVFNDLVRKSEQWDDVLEGLRDALKTPQGQKVLGAGFYPENVEVYRRMVEML